MLSLSPLPLPFLLSLSLSRPITLLLHFPLRSRPAIPFIKGPSSELLSELLVRVQAFLLRCVKAEIRDLVDVQHKGAVWIETSHS